jgi:iron complex outermembrane receptor protein
MMISLDPVVIEGERMDVLPSHEIRREESAELSRILSRMQGLRLVRKGPLGSDLIIRGLGSRNYSVIIDGGQVFGGCPSGMDPPIFHVYPYSPESVRVIKNSFDLSRYGTLGPLVFIRSKEPRRLSEGTLSLSQGSFGYIRTHIEGAFRRESGLFFTGLHSFSRSLPYMTGEGKPVTSYANYKEGEEKKPAFRAHRFLLRTGLVRGSFKMSLTYSGERFINLIYPYLMMDSPENTSDSMSLQIVSERTELSVYSRAVYHRMDNSRRTSPMSMESTSNSRTFGIHLLRKSERYRVGAELIYRSWDSVLRKGTSYQYTLPDVRTFTGGFFGELFLFNKKDFKVSLSGRIDYINQRADESKAFKELYFTYHSTKRDSVSFFYPSASLFFTSKPSRGSELYGGISYRFRAPDPQERFFALNRDGMMETLYGDWVGNPELRPPKSVSLEGGFSKRFRRINTRGDLYCRFTFDHIVLTSKNAENSTGLGSRAKTYVNTDAVLCGAEYLMNVALSERLVLSAGGSYMRGVKKRNSSLNLSDPDLPSVPPPRAIVSLIYEEEDLFLEAEVIAEAPQPHADSDAGEIPSKGWETINLRGGYEMSNFRIRAELTNLLNRFYYSHLSYVRDPFYRGSPVPEPGRSLRITLSYVF